MYRSRRVRTHRIYMYCVLLECSSETTPYQIQGSRQRTRPLSCSYIGISEGGICNDGCDGAALARSGQGLICPVVHGHSGLFFDLFSILVDSFLVSNKQRGSHCPVSATYPPPTLDAPIPQPSQLLQSNLTWRVPPAMLPSSACP